MIDIKKYEKFCPRRGYVLVKDITKGDTTLLKSVGEKESRAYGRIVAHWEQWKENGEPTEKKPLLLGKLIVFNQYAGQELEKFKDIVDEDDLYLMKEEDIICEIKE